MPPYSHTRVPLVLLFDLCDIQVSSVKLQLRCLRGDCFLRLLPVMPL
jgi:hypothetical protein